MLNMKPRDWLLGLTLLTFPLGIILGLVFHIHMGLWMGAWFVASLGYLAVFSNTAAKTEGAQPKHD